MNTAIVHKFVKLKYNVQLMETMQKSFFVF